LNNKPKISDTVCPHCGSSSEREITGSFSTDGTNSGPITQCSDCKKEIKDFWWCETCHDMIEPEHVTFDERHDARAGGCGNKVV